jgi:hypothetical protein
MTMRLLLGFLTTTLVGPAVAGPPERPDGRIVLDPIPELRAEVLRCEQEYARDNADDRAEKLAEARARLAEAEGRWVATVEEWEEVLFFRDERLHLIASGKICRKPRDIEIRGGEMAQARCRIAEIKGDAAVLTAELPWVIAGYQAKLELYWGLGAVGALSPDDSKDQKAVGEALRMAKRRLGIVRRTLGQP